MYSKDKTRTTPYKTQSDGMIERANWTIENTSSVFVSHNQKDLDDLLPLFMLAYPFVVYKSIGISSSQSVFRRSVTIPVNLIMGWVAPEKDQFRFKSEYAHKSI
jgi:hypothetical protein